MNNSESTKITPAKSKKTLQSYITGFVLSIILTLVPYILVTKHIVNGFTLVTIIVAFAFVQLLVQMLFFLHMKEESKPRLNLLVFISFFGVIVIVVVASIWIMQHLNYNMNLMQLKNVMQYGEGF
jgi:cytochrome o ubiquinol oxidase operon protein cyoD